MKQDLAQSLSAEQKQKKLSLDLLAQAETKKTKFETQGTEDSSDSLSNDQNSKSQARQEVFGIH